MNTSPTSPGALMHALPPHLAAPADSPPAKRQCVAPPPAVPIIINVDLYGHDPPPPTLRPMDAVLREEVDAPLPGSHVPNSPDAASAAFAPPNSDYVPHDMFRASVPSAVPPNLPPALPPAVPQAKPGETSVVAPMPAEAAAMARPEPRSSSEVEIVVLDDDEDEPAMAPSQVLPEKVDNIVRSAPKRPRSPPAAMDVIDVDDDEELERLVRLPQQRKRPPLGHARPLRVAGAVDAGPFEPHRVYVSRGGGLFRVEATGTVDIVDSDDEADLRNKDLLINQSTGMASLHRVQPSATQGAKVATSRTQPRDGVPFRVLREAQKGATESAPAESAGSAPPTLPRPAVAGHATLQSEGSAPAAMQLPTVVSATSDLVKDMSLSMQGHPPAATAAANDSQKDTLLPTFAPHLKVGSGSTFSNGDLAPWPGMDVAVRPDPSQLMGIRPQGLVNTATSALYSSGEGLSQTIGHGNANMLLPAAAECIIPSHSSGPTGHQQVPMPTGQPLIDMPTQVRFSIPPMPNGDLGRPQFRAIPTTAIVQPIATETHDAAGQHVSNGSTGVVGGPSNYRDPPGEGFSAKELRNLVKQNELTADATEEAETPRQMNVTLMPHQRRALAWMEKRERPIHTDEDIIAVDEECLGGILADDQGLGKTLSMIALLVKNPPSKTGAESEDLSGDSDASLTCEDSDADFVDDSPESVDEHPPWRTLIVCPVSVLNQWKDEIVSRIEKKYTPSICMYHGPKRERRAKALKKYDIVITTYSTLANEYPKILKDHPDYALRKEEKLDLPRRRAGPVCQVSWHRVILDEAQYVKNRGTDSWSAVMSLEAEKRWCLTGTPIQNCVDDLYSLFCFIRYRFVPNYEMWNLKWKRHLESTNSRVRERAFKRFQTITGVVLLRRTKRDTINGQPLISLPARIAEVYLRPLADADEVAVYQAVRDKAVLQVNKFLVEGTLNANYSSVLLALLRMRQACSHPFLIQYSQMQRRRGLGQGMDTKYNSAYTQEELEEALELVGDGHSLVDMIEESVREKVSKLLVPPAKGQVVCAVFSCLYCQQPNRWTDGFFLGCGDVFCRQCCRHIQQTRGCLRCGYSIPGVDDTESFISADHLRKEVHARAIRGETGGNSVNLSAAEFKGLIQEELVRRKRAQEVLKRVASHKDDDADSDGDDGDDDMVLGEVRRRSTSYRQSAGCRQNNKEQSGVQGHSRRRLLDALSQHSTKIGVMIEELDTIRKQNTGEKTLIFSQWTSFLDIIEFHVQLHGHEVCRLDGSMTATKRQEQVQEFRESKTKNVFLISLGAGGTGLNLTVGNRVILADVWWNPAVEEQAIDRCHRIGQTKPVHVSRFKMLHTVEERIYAICERKRQMADGTLGVVGKRNLGRTKMSVAELLSLFSGEAQDMARTAAAGSAAAQAANNILNYQLPF